MDPRSFCDEISKTFRNLSKLLNLSNDDFIRTTEERHRKSVDNLWKILEAKNENIESIHSIFNQYKLETYVIGVTGGNKIKLNNTIDITVDDAKKSWENGLRNKL